MSGFRDREMFTAEIQSRNSLLLPVWINFFFKSNNEFAALLVWPSVQTVVVSGQITQDMNQEACFSTFGWSHYFLKFSLKSSRKLYLERLRKLQMWHTEIISLVLMPVAGTVTTLNLPSTYSILHSLFGQKDCGTAGKLPRKRWQLYSDYRRRWISLTTGLIVVLFVSETVDTLYISRFLSEVSPFSLLFLIG